MKILFTGASSFTGCWFVRRLAKAGHEVTATFQRPQSAYEGLRRRRVDALVGLCRPIFGCSFGDETFCSTIDKADRWDLLCHHAADVTNYRSADFNVSAALASNTRNLPDVLRRLLAKGCRRLVVTGSVFEMDEGAGEDDRWAFSPYGLSKGLTWQYVRYYATAAGMKAGKFVIPNPIGPLEEARFTSFLARSWLSGQTPQVKTPAYVRDNIHVSLLAMAYADFAAGPQADAVAHFGPGQYQESQGEFTARFADQMRPRLGVPCKFELARQTEFPEPRHRVNTDRLDAGRFGWDEAKAWDELADYYLAAQKDGWK